VADEHGTDTTILFIRQGDQKDGYAEVHIDPEGRYATAAFYPPAAGGAFLTYPTVAARLEENGITGGVLHDAIQDAILKANSSRSSVQNVTIAACTPPVDEIPEHFIIRKDLLERKPEIDPNAARVDWHTISAFSIVQQKEPIAKRIPRNEGKPGVNIHGEEMPSIVRQMPVFSAGANVIDHEKGLFAGKNGRLSISNAGLISVEEVLVLNKGVDYTTGNITFPGDIILKGKVADGFKVYSGGSIVSADVLDVTEIVCKKDLIVKGGIEGRSRGALRIGGSLTAKYIQNCRVAVRGDIVVSGSIMQSKVYSMGTIHMGETGTLVGCECIIIGGVQALDIGSKRGAKTWVRVGTDFTVQQELDIANEQMKTLAVKLQRAEAAYAEGPSPELEKYIEEIKAKKAEIANKIPLYLPNIDKNDGATVEIHGTVYPGTEIEICHVPLSVTKEQKQVIFRLDKARGTIVAEPYKKNSKS
jgi:uncharacterized protein (DUF342 family)